MRPPTFKSLARMHLLEPGMYFCSGTLTWMSLNPRFYKMKWWVFHEGSHVEGRDFMTDEYSLCTSDALALIKKVTSEGKSCLVYNRRCRRLGPDTPFKHDEESMSGWSWAPAFDDDTDPEYKGHK